MLDTTETTEATPKAKGKRPDLIAYNVNKRNPQDKGFWNRNGAAWLHADKKGFTIKMDDGREIILRSPNPKATN